MRGGPDRVGALLRKTEYGGGTRRGTIGAAPERTAEVRKQMLERFKVPAEDRVYVQAEDARAATEAIFLAMGLSDVDAAQSADVLITNDLRGVETHGVSNMLRNYVARYRDGTMNPRPEIKIERETDTTAVIDADRGLGAHIAAHAMRMAMDKADRHGLGAVCVQNVGHMAGAGYHAALGWERDMIGVAMSASGGVQTVPTFGAEARFGTNPIAWAAPAGEMPPFLFDIATTQVAGNKMQLARRVGARLEPAWISTPDGTPIMEEVSLPDEYFMLPFGGTREQGSHKGYGFASIVDIMASTLTGLGPGFISLSTGFHLVAYSIDAFTDVAEYRKNMDDFLRGLVETPPAPGHERVVYPGFLEAEETEKRLREGIPYHREVVGWFGKIESELGLEFAFT